MIQVARPMDLAPYAGEELGVSSWLSLSEADVLTFAGVTRDHHWVHTDPERARRETPFNGILVHGFLTLSLTTNLLNECLEIGTAARWVNYGVDRLRFLHPVVPGSRLRLRATLSSYAPLEHGARLSLAFTMLIVDARKRGFTADWTVLFFEDAG
jgi:acyl dehydratase